jgi:hypothetical protein
VKKLFLLLVIILLLGSGGFTQPIACRLLRNVPVSLKTICDSARKVTNDYNDHGNCIIQLVDSLKDGFIKTHNTNYLVCLDSICWNSIESSNDYIIEHISDSTLFYHCFKPFVDYLYTNDDTMNCLTIALTGAFGFDMMEDANDKQDAKNRLKNFIAEQEKNYNLPEGEKKLLDFIRKQAEEFNNDDKD